MDSASLAIVPSRGRHIAEALSNALGRGERNDGEGAAALATPALTLLQSESCHPEPERRRQASASRGRRKLWQLPSVYHCSLLGVCLGLAGSYIVVVPLDCVSHDASRRLKRRCRRQGKTILWLRTASVSAFENALRQAMQEQVQEAERECAFPS